MTEVVLPATCRSFDPDSGGEVVLDDGRCLAFDAAALAGSRLRLLRPGQRVRVAVSPTAAGPGVIAVWLPSMPRPTAAG